MTTRFQPVPASAFGLVVVAGANAARHVLCGKQEIRGARCPNCDKPLTQMVCFDTSDPRLEVAVLGVVRLPLLICWRCPLSRGLQYRLAADGGVEILHYASGRYEADFPYADYPESFPAAGVDLHWLESVSDGAQHQVSGRPRFLQGEPRERCCVCRKPMRFHASFTDEATEGWSVAGNSAVRTLFLLCLDDGVVCATHEIE